MLACLSRMTVERGSDSLFFKIIYHLFPPGSPGVAARDLKFRMNRREVGIEPATVYVKVPAQLSFYRKPCEHLCLCLTVVARDKIIQWNKIIRCDIFLVTELTPFPPFTRPVQRCPKTSIPQLVLDLSSEARTFVIISKV